MKFDGLKRLGWLLIGVAIAVEGIVAVYLFGMSNLPLGQAGPVIVAISLVLGGQVAFGWLMIQRSDDEPPIH